METLSMCEWRLHIKSHPNKRALPLLHFSQVLIIYKIKFYTALHVHSHLLIEGIIFLLQALYFLPLLLYKLGKEVEADVKQCLLYSIPQLATHKVCKPCLCFAVN